MILGYRVVVSLLLQSCIFIKRHSWPFTYQLSNGACCAAVLTRHEKCEPLLSTLKKQEESSSEHCKLLGAKTVSCRLYHSVRIHETSDNLHLYYFSI